MLWHAGEPRGDISPPRQSKREKGERSYSWATARIHELTQELEATKAKLKVCKLTSDPRYG